MSLYSLGLFKFLHQGHCAGSGYLGSNTNQGTINDCRQECKGRAEGKYFAYVSGSTCACYKTECKFDGKNMDHMAFEILEPGYNLMLYYLHCYILEFLEYNEVHIVNFLH